MTNRARIWIAAGVTAIFLTAVSIAGIANRDAEPRAATATAGRPAAEAAPATEDGGSVSDGVLDRVLAEADAALQEWLGDDE